MSDTARAKVLVATVCAAALASGCASASGGASPRASLGALARAARSEDGVAAVYAMLPARHRRAESLDAFRARMVADRQELAALGEDVAASLAQRGGPQARVALVDRGAVVIVDDPDGWRVADPGFGPPVAAAVEGIDGARAVVRALHDALRRHGAGAWVATLSGRARGSVVAETASLIEATEDPATLEYVDNRSRVSFRLPDGRMLDAVFEAGAWRIDGLRDP